MICSAPLLKEEPMAWVRLIDLLDVDSTGKNLRGMIPLDIPATVIAGYPDTRIKEDSTFCALPLLKDSTKIKNMGDKKCTLQQFIDQHPEDANDAEWSLAADGHLQHWGGPYKVNGKFGSVVFLSLDISDWLKSQPADYLAELCGLQTIWARDEEDTKLGIQRVQYKNFHRQMQDSFQLEIPFLDTVIIDWNRGPEPRKESLILQQRTQ